MKTLILLVLLLLVPQLAAAKVYMCVDKETGEASFTDRACDNSDVREEVRVQTANLDSGKNSARAAKPKTWRSQTDTRKTGLDYNTERRSLYTNKATASAH
jgi:hypothetical protein